MTGAWYLLQVNIYIVIFYIFYRVFLRWETWFMLNRIYLLLSVIFSLLIPFVKPEWILPHEARPGLSIEVGDLQMLLVDTNVADSGLAFSWGKLIALVYICGVILSALLLMARLYQVRQLLTTDSKGMAFSFFGRKVVDEHLEGQAVIHTHENVHIRQFHSLDIIFFEILGIMLWCNPVIYLYQKSIKNIHEYLADEVAVGLTGDKKSYAMLLVSKAFNVDKSILTNSFFTQSLIKKQIIMLNKQRSAKTAILKYGLFLPLFAGMLLLSSAKISTNDEMRDLVEHVSVPLPTLATKSVLQDTTNKKRSKNVKQSAPSTSREAAGKEKGAKVIGFTAADTPPSFPGGMNKFYQYLAKGCKYPEEAIAKNIQGKVLLSFIVEKDGRLSEIKVIQPLGGGTDEEAKRLLESSPKWNPGKQGGKLVRVQYHMPISFKTSGTVQSITGFKKDNTADSATVTLRVVKKDGLSISGPDKPMILVDGVKTTVDVMRTIDPNTIESMHVIKDKDALVKYGEAGKNGVILIVSKQAKSIEGRKNYN